MDGKWVNWFNKPDRTTIIVKSEAYETGALLVLDYFEKWEKDYPEEEVVAGKEYYLEDTYILDFEFSLRKFAVNV